MIVALSWPGMRRRALVLNTTWSVVFGITTMSSWSLPNPPTEGAFSSTPITVYSMAPMRTFLPIGSSPCLAKRP